MTVREKRFVHLNVHTEYGLLSSTIRINELADRARVLGMNAVAITDDGVMFGVMDFYKTMIRAGIKPIIGCDCYLAPRTIADKTLTDHRDVSRLTLLAENMEGYRNLCRSATIAATSGYYFYPRLDKELLRQYSRGLICLSGGVKSDITRLLQQGKKEEAESAARFYQQVFGADNFFLEIQCTVLPGQAGINHTLREMGRGLSIPLVGTNNCRYLDAGDGQYLEIALCVKADKTIKDADHPKVESDQLYFKSAEEMRALLVDFPQAAENTAAIADRCCVEFDFKTKNLPRTSLEEETGRSADDLLKEKSEQGLWRRLKKRRTGKHSIDEETYRRRLNHELAVIQQAGMAGYFLLVSEILDYAAANDIPVGPGRGSAPGCLVCYCLGITAVDPVVHGLLFERFLNFPARPMQEIFLDFCNIGRHQIIQYVLDKYNKADVLEHRAAPVVTFGCMRSRATIRKVGMVLDPFFLNTEKVTNFITSSFRNLDDALAKKPALKALVDSRPEYGRLMQISRKLERQLLRPAMPVASIVIGDKPLCQYLPLFTRKEKILTQFNSWEVEAIGLVKLDLLGMRSLTVIKNTLTLIKRYGKTPPDIYNLDMADKPTYQLLCRGDTGGIFNLERSGVKELLIKMKPEAYADIAALDALYRPWLLKIGFVDDFISRKHGRKEVVYLVPELEPILKETYGLILYQEQVMRIAQQLAGFSPEQSDIFRREMGIKRLEEIKKFQPLFVNGLIANGADEKIARELFEQIECFSSFCTIKAHYLAYTLIAYQSAYLKAHFREEFMAAWQRQALPNKG